MLNHVDLPRGFAECLRVLKPGGSMLVYVTLATEQCEPREAARLWEALAILPANMERGYFERCARAAGFEVAKVDPIDSEGRGHAIESGDQWGELKASAADGFVRPLAGSASTGTIQGKVAYRSLQSVIGTMIRSRSLPTVSELTTTAGRVFRISSPRVGSRSTHHTSPRFGSGIIGRIQEVFAVKGGESR